MSPLVQCKLAILPFEQKFMEPRWVATWNTLDQLFYKFLSAQLDGGNGWSSKFSLWSLYSLVSCWDTTCNNKIKSCFYKQSFIVCSVPMLQGDVWALSIRILAFPSPTSYMLWSFRCFCFVWKGQKANAKYIKINFFDLRYRSLCILLKVIGNFPEVLNFNQFICNKRSVLSDANMIKLYKYLYV